MSLPPPAWVPPPPVDLPEGGRRRLVGLADDIEADPTIQRLRASGRLDVGFAPSVPHVDLLEDPSVIARTIDSMLRHASESPDTAGTSETAKASDEGSLPRDPLARAEALRERARRDLLDASATPG